MTNVFKIGKVLEIDTTVEIRYVGWQIGQRPHIAWPGEKNPPITEGYLAKMLLVDKVDITLPFDDDVISSCTVKHPTPTILNLAFEKVSIIQADYEKVHPDAKE
jgi:hypothetical protein